jgi:hypothetical protein
MNTAWLVKTEGHLSGTQRRDKDLSEIGRIFMWWEVGLVELYIPSRVGKSFLE